jgi:trigger factor
MALTAEVTNLEENRVRLEVSVPEDEVRREFDKAVRKVGREVRVPGFRAGKVPPQVVMQRVGREVVVEEMLRSSLGGWYSTAVEEAGLAPIDDPEFDLDRVPDEGDLQFSATVQVRPSATLGQYRSLEVGKADPEVPEGALEEQLEALRTRAGRLQPVERAAQHGDFVVIDFEGYADGKRLRTAGARDYLAQLGAGRLVGEFEKRLTGASAGDVLEFPVAYERGDARGELSGRTVDYRVTVKMVQERVLPDLDDDLALEATEFETLDEVRADIGRRLAEAAQEQVDELFRRMVIDAVVEKAEVDVPEVMVDRRVGAILNQTAQQLPQGVSFEQYLSATGQTIDGLITELRPDAEMAIRRELVVEAVADAEGIEVGDGEIEAQVRSDAEATGRSAERLLHELREHGGWETLRADLRMKRAVDLLVEATTAIPMARAEAREKLWTPEQERARAKERAQEEAGTEAPAGKLWTPGDPR